MGGEVKRYPLQGFITMRVNGLDGIVSRRLTGVSGETGSGGCRYVLVESVI